MNRTTWMALWVILAIMLLPRAGVAAELLGTNVALRVTLEARPYAAWENHTRTQTETAVRDGLLETLNRFDLAHFYPGTEDDLPRLEIQVACNSSSSELPSCDLEVWIRLFTEGGIYPQEEYDAQKNRITPKSIPYARRHGPCVSAVRADKEGARGRKLQDFLSEQLNRQRGFAALVDALSGLAIAHDVVPDARKAPELYWVVPSEDGHRLDIQQLIFRIRGSVDTQRYEDVPLLCSADFDGRISDSTDEYELIHRGKWRLQVLEKAKGKVGRHDDWEECRDAMVHRLEPLESIRASVSVIDFKGVPSTALRPTEER